MHMEIAERPGVDPVLARTLAKAIDGSSKPRRTIARETGLHKDALLGVIRGTRAVTTDEALRLFSASGVPPKGILALALARRGQAGDEGAPPQRATPTKVPLAGLDPNGAIHWGPVDGPRAIVFSDFNCSYCKKLEAELIAIGARVEERPISILAKESRTLAEQVLCAEQPAAALRKAYAGLHLQSLRKAKP